MGLMPLIVFKKCVLMALINVAQLVGHRSAKQKVSGSNPSEGTCLGCGFNPQVGHYKR